MTEPTDLDMAVSRLLGFAGSPTGDFNTVTVPGGLASMYASDLRTILTALQKRGGADLHVRAEADGLRLYDGLLRLEGPWAASEYAEAMMALRKARAALAATQQSPISGEGAELKDAIFLYFADQGRLNGTRMADLNPDGKGWSLEEHLLIRAHRFLASPPVPSVSGEGGR